MKYDGQRPGREALPTDLTPLRYEIWPGTSDFGSSQHDTHVHNERAQYNRRSKHEGGGWRFWSLRDDNGDQSGIITDDSAGAVEKRQVRRKHGMLWIWPAATAGGESG